MEAQKPFRVVIVGAGLVGLTAAHIFSKAGIDFIILEKHDTPLSVQGATLALWPHTLRIFDQLGLLEPAQSIFDTFKEVVTLSTDDAYIRMRDEMPLLIEKNHGHGIKIMYRPDMVKFLYESLPEAVKSRVLLKKRVTDITVSEDGVKVICADGSTEEGSIVIGADGVRSRVRPHMQALKRGMSVEDLPESLTHPYVASYRLYFASLPILPGLATNTRYDGTGDGVSTQIVNGTDTSLFGLYEKIDPPTSKITRYTETDKSEILDRRGHLYMAPGWKFRDVDEKKIGEAGLINLEEGLIDEWSHKRIVLVGDAVRKLEPHAGLGFNDGVTDLVVLVNGLRRLLRDNKSPSTAALEDLFQTYHKDRLDNTKKMMEMSMQTPRLLGWLDWRSKIMAKYILPNFPLSKMHINGVLGPVISDTPVLEWLEERALPKSLIAWKHHPVIESK
ncbi:putative monooxygenase [Hypomontagnella monticulosa]|nr:putative monooxygenase [Hypomontagnella monticulosa]